LEGKLISFLSDVFERCYGLNGRLAELAAGRGVLVRPVGGAHPVVSVDPNARV